MGAVDLGGSHVAAAVVGPGWTLGPLVVRRFGPVARTAGDTLALVAEAMVGAGAADTWVLGAPGPFDYERGVCWIRDQNKLNELYGVDLRAELAKRVGVDPVRIRFVNDAVAAAVGEWVAGAGVGAARLIYVSIGTGLGSAVLRGGVVVDGDLYLTPLRGEIADAWISTGGLLRRVGGGVGVVAGDAVGRDSVWLAERARGGDAVALGAFRAVGDDLAAVLRGWIAKHEPELIVVGGGLSHTLDLLSVGELAACEVPIRQARHPETSALIGAAAHVARPEPPALAT